MVERLINHPPLMFRPSDFKTDWNVITPTGEKARLSRGTKQFGGQHLSWSTDGNINPSHPIQQDCLGLMAIPRERIDNDEHCTASEDPPRPVLDGLLAAAMASCFDLAENPKFSGGSTLLAAEFDPLTYTIDLRGIGDSLAFLVADDGNQCITTKISSSDHEVFNVGVFHHRDFETRISPSEVMLNSLGAADGELFFDGDLDTMKGIWQPAYHLNDHSYCDLNGTSFVARGFRPNPNDPKQSGVEPVDPKLYATEAFGLDPAALHHGPINLHDFKHQLAEARGMDEKNIRLSLVVTSDGITKRMKRDEIGPMLGSGTNKALQLTRACKMNSGTHPSSDNLSVAVISDLKEGHGDRIYLTVADGYRPDGHHVAECVTKSMRNYMAARFELPVQAIDQQPNRPSPRR